MQPRTSHRGTSCQLVLNVLQGEGKNDVKDTNYAGCHGKKNADSNKSGRRRKMRVNFMFLFMVFIVFTANDTTAGQGGALAGSIVGGIIGHNVGSSSIRPYNTLIGAVAGGFIGHAIEESAKDNPQAKPSNYESLELPQRQHYKYNERIPYHYNYTIHQNVVKPSKNNSKYYREDCDCYY
jgi:hypothetical protein